MSMRALLSFGLLFLFAGFPALSTGGDAQKAPAELSDDCPQFVRTGGCEVIKQKNLIVLKGHKNEAPQILTTKEYKPPFALRINAKTDSKNLRLYYNVGVLILNWEGNEDELRIHDPATSEQMGVADKGKIEPDKYHHIVWEIYPDGMRVLVDGMERARKLGDYEKLEASLGIGPAFGSIITMKSFRVEALKGKLPEWNEAEVLKQLVLLGCEWLIENVVEIGRRFLEALRESWGLAIEEYGHADFHLSCVCFPNPEWREQHVRRSVLSRDGVVRLLGGGCV